MTKSIFIGLILLSHISYGQKQCKIKSTEETSFKANLAADDQVKNTGLRTSFSIDIIEGIPILTQKALKGKILEESRRVEHRKVLWDKKGDWISIEEILSDSFKLVYSSTKGYIEKSYYTNQKKRIEERTDFDKDGLIEKKWRFDKGQAVLLQDYSSVVDENLMVIKYYDHNTDRIDSLWYKEDYIIYKKKSVQAESLLFTESWLFVYNGGSNKFACLRRNLKGEIILKEKYTYNKRGQLVNHHSEDSLRKESQVRKRSYDQQGNITLDDEMFVYTSLNEGFFTPTEFKYKYNQHNDWIECVSLWAPPNYSGQKKDLRAKITFRKIVYYNNSCNLKE